MFPTPAGGRRGSAAENCCFLIIDCNQQSAIDNQQFQGFTIMLMPKKVKYRKQQRGRMAGKAWRGADVSFGNYGLKALEPGGLTARQAAAGGGGGAGRAGRGWDASFGTYGLRALEPCWLTDRQIEAARVAMTRFIKRGGKIWGGGVPDKPITKKPQETRPGAGK